MQWRTVLASLLCFQVAEVVPEDLKPYDVEGYLSNESPPSLIFKIRPQDFQGNKQSRQDDYDEDDPPSTTPFIPEIIPGLTKIFNGIVTGNLNEIFHGSTSFAPKNVSYAIDTVYNQVVGLPPPRTTARTVATTARAANGTNLNAGATASASTATAASAAGSSEDDDDDDYDEYDDISSSRQFHSAKKTSLRF